MAQLEPLLITAFVSLLVGLIAGTAVTTSLLRSRTAT
jgi:hypothetical protein